MCRIAAAAMIVPDGIVVPVESVISFIAFRMTETTTDMYWFLSGMNGNGGLYIPCSRTLYLMVSLKKLSNFFILVKELFVHPDSSMTASASSLSAAAYSGLAAR